MKTKPILLSILTLAAGVSVTNAGVLISEFRTRGPNGAADEFVELYNNSDNPVDISGWKINGSNSSGTTGTRATISAGTTIPARAHFLATNSTPSTGYSGTVAGNQTYTTGIADDGGVALLMPDNTIVDQVGMSTGSAYKEGTVLTPLTTNTDQGYERKPGGAGGSTQDTGDNATDFQLRSPSIPQNLSSAATPLSLVVTDLGDDGGANQLRGIISACLSAGGGGVITFSPGLSGTVTLVTANGPLPTITANVTVDGGGVIEVSGNDAIRIFNVNTGATLTVKNITLSHALANSDGGAIASTGAVNTDHAKFLHNSTSASSSGSAILCWGPLTITNCEFGYNTGGGGAVKPRSSDAITTITGSNFHDNQSTNSAGAGYGGAMQLHDALRVSVNSSTFTNNTAWDGGAIYVNANSALNAAYCTFNGNSTTGNDGGNNGGAISLSTINSTLIIHDSTFSGNSALVGFGGAIYNEGNANIFRVTFAGNEAYAGGALNNWGNATLENVTFAGNNGGFGGGGIYTTNTLGYGGVSLTNGTFVGNLAHNPGASGIDVGGNPSVGITDTVFDGDSFFGATNCVNVSGGNHNYSTDNSCGFVAGGGADNVAEADLAWPYSPGGSYLLVYNGGFTPTILPMPGSVLINHGTATAAPPRDQRGFTRDATPDVGAVEVGGTLPVGPSSVTSVKTHGASAFGIDLPLTGNGTVECRSGGGTGAHQILLNFPGSVGLTGVSVTKGTGIVSSYLVNGSQITVNLTGVTNAQSLFATLFNVSNGADANDITVPISFLVGDTTGDGSVNSADISQTKSKSGQTLGPGNFRNDVTVDGNLNSADISLVKSKSGTALP
jgi:hypothetical protein